MEQEITSLNAAYEGFLADLKQIQPGLDLPPEVADYLDVARQAAFAAGWTARGDCPPPVDPEESTVRLQKHQLAIRDLVDVGDRAWIQPHAIVEDMSTHEFFVDPMFSVSWHSSEHHCIELVVADEGLIAFGPTDRHRLAEHADRSRLRPLVGIEPRLVE